MKTTNDRPKKIVQANSKPCSKCEKSSSRKGKRLMFDDYEEELREYAMDSIGSYQGSSVWAGTGNVGLGGTRQLATQRLNKATKKVADLEVNLDLADQRGDDNFEDEYAEEQLRNMEKKFMDHNIVPEAFPKMSSSPGGRESSFANLPGYPRQNSLEKKMDFIPDDQEKTEEEEMKDNEEEWIDHLMTQPQTTDQAAQMSKTMGKQLQVQAGLQNQPEKIKRNFDTHSNVGTVGGVIAPKKFVPDEIDQYTDGTKDILWKIGRKNIF